jgi:hypothetical protein
MIISRCGSGRNHGIKNVSLENGNIEWREDSIRITKRDVTDFNGSAQHDYFINIRLDELAGMLAVVANDGAADAPEAISSAFAKSVKSLVRLTYLGLGGKVAPPKPRS